MSTGHTPPPADEVARYAGKVIVVTGASRGLGAGLAARFAEYGIDLGLCARNVPTPPDGVRTVASSVDVQDADAVESFAFDVTNALGPIDLWINNAGILDPIGPLRDVEPSKITEHVGVNVLGVMWGSRAFARIVHDRDQEGTLVNISSGAGRTPYEGWSIYCASKAAVDQLSRVLAQEASHDGLRVVSLAPGVVDTDMQSAIRATPTTRFPSVQRFHQLKADDAFNDAWWIADRILELTWKSPPPWIEASADPVVVRLPNQKP